MVLRDFFGLFNLETWQFESRAFIEFDIIKVILKGGSVNLQPLCKFTNEYDGGIGVDTGRGCCIHNHYYPSFRLCYVPLEH